MVQLSSAWLPFNARLAPKPTEVGFSRLQGIPSEQDEVGSPPRKTALGYPPLPANGRGDAPRFPQDGGR
eukprot:1310814-Alexandrium_andersonii.AAC.1